MAKEWDPIDPDDVVDLFIDCGGTKPFIPEGESIATGTLVVTVPAEVNKVTSDFAGKILRVRVGPCESGKHMLHYHFDCVSGQEFDFDVFLTVKERIVK